MSWIIFCEAQADFATASELIDRVLRDRAPSWVADLFDATPEAVRKWSRDGKRDWWDLHRIRAYLDERNLKALPGHFDGKPGAADAAAARNAFVLARHLAKSEPIEALVLIRDANGDAAGRGKGQEQARKLTGWDFVRVLALAIRSREAWVLAGFEPENERERETHADLKKKLGYCPLEAAHRLDSKSVSKDAVEALTDKDWERQERCWREAPLDRLRARGGESGLARFLADVESELLPLIVGSGRS